MRWRRDKGPSHAEQALKCEVRRGGGQRAHHPEGAATVHHRLQNGTQCFDKKRQRRRRKLCLKGRDGASELFEREHHIHHDAQFRLKATRQALRAGLENIHPTHDRARFCKKRQALTGEHRGAAGAIEQLDAKLRLQIRKRLADDGLRSSQAASARRKASFIGCRDEHAQVVEGNAVEHISSLTMVCIEKYRLPRLETRRYCCVGSPATPEMKQGSVQYSGQGNVQCSEQAPVTSTNLKRSAHA